VQKKECISSNGVLAKKLLAEVEDFRQTKCKYAEGSTSRFAGGGINETFKVELSGKRYVCQRVSSTVFGDNSAALDSNYARFKAAYAKWSAETGRTFEFPEWLEVGDGCFHLRTNGSCWRFYPFIHAVPLAKLEHNNAICVHARLLADVHQVLSLFDGKPEPTIEGFHSLEHYNERYLCAKARSQALDLYCERMITEHFDSIMSDLEFGKRDVVHGDPKAGNVLFDEACGNAVLLDLDTISLGSRALDVGDAVRSIASATYGLMRDGENRQYDHDPCILFVEEYLNSMAGFDHAGLCDIPKAVLRMPFELGLRFYVDYFSEDGYFNQSSEQVLERAKRQFNLYEQLLESGIEREIEAMVKPAFHHECRKGGETLIARSG